MDRIQLAQVGCGGMGLRHTYGLIELKARGFDTFDLIALCDLQSSAADRVATVAEEGLGKRPKIYTNFDQMLDEERRLDAINIVTDTRSHHVFATKALEADKHVAVEKPMGLTVRACRAMIEAASDAKKVLSVSENYRRDPMNRLVKALLDAGVIGEPRLVFYASIGGGRMVQQLAGWRHMKLRGGYVLEYGVHDADLLLHFMGDVGTVYAETRLWEKTRYTADRPLADQLARFYTHRVKEEGEKGEVIECTAEDMALALIRFGSGATGQFAMTIATPGEGIRGNVIYGSEGSLKLPGSRSGRRVELMKRETDRFLEPEEVLRQVPKFQLGDTTSSFFDHQRRLYQYDMSFEQIDRILVAMELQDFADAILNDKEPEVSGEVGLRAVALCYAMLESGYVRKPVSFSDVVEDRINAYQREINENIGL